MLDSIDVKENGMAKIELAGDCGLCRGNMSKHRWCGDFLVRTTKRPENEEVWRRSISGRSHGCRAGSLSQMLSKQTRDLEHNTLVSEINAFVVMNQNNQ